MLIPLLIAGTATNPAWRPSRILEAQLVRWVGRLSDSLYLWQLFSLVDTNHSPNRWRRPQAITLSRIPYGD